MLCEANIYLNALGCNFFFVGRNPEPRLKRLSQLVHRVPVQNPANEDQGRFSPDGLSQYSK